MNTDLVALKRLIKFPAEVSHGEWQTGKLAPHGGDWWVAAVLVVDVGKMTAFLPGQAIKSSLETPPGMTLDGSFALLKSTPGAQPVEPDRLRVVADVHGVAPYANSPLLHGQSIRLSATQVFVVLWTN